MTTFGDLLEERKDTIVERWVDAVLSAYPSDSAAIFRAQQDPFANPLGHHVREGTRGVFQALLDGMDPEELRTHLDEIVRIRAVQELTPSQSLSFVFSLRSIVRDVIPEANERHQDGLAGWDEKIDEVALAAFELYSAMREELAQLRIKEVKRQVGWVFEKMNQRDAEALQAHVSPDRELQASDNVQREDPR